MTIPEPHRLSELEEVIGKLHRIEITEIGLIAVIGKVSVLLPEELAGKLQGLVGCRIDILRLDSYYVRRLDGDIQHKSSGQSDR